MNKLLLIFITLFVIFTVLVGILKPPINDAVSFAPAYIKLKEAENSIIEQKIILKTENKKTIKKAPSTIIIKPTKSVKTIDKTIEKKTLAQKEEVIQWNIWHSQIQNKIMQDAKIIAPRGTYFQFSFTVDENGTISNLVTKTANPNYSYIAETKLRPLIIGYQGQPVLNFPMGTKRQSANFEGSFTIASTKKLSHPQDYSDIEKVKVGGF